MQRYGNVFRNRNDMLKNNVKTLRLEKKLSKAHLARQIGVCRSYVSKLEAGSLQPSGEVMFRIAGYFKLRLEDIFQRAGKLDNRQHFFCAKPLPYGNTSTHFLTSPGHAGGQQTGHSARQSAGHRVAKDKQQNKYATESNSGIGSP
jgi:DNA-binding XRE family transcriptional regulator